MLTKLSEGYEVVYGVRRTRQATFVMGIVYRIYYRIMSFLTDVSIPIDVGDFCVMTQSVVKAMMGLHEKTRFLRGMRAWVGFKQIGFPYDRPARFADESKYSIPKLLRLWI